MQSVLNFAFHFLDLMASFGTTVLSVFSTPVFELIDRLPVVAQVIIAPGLEVLQWFGVGESITLLELTFGIGVTLWLVWAFVKFLLPTS